MNETESGLDRQIQICVFRLESGVSHERNTEISTVQQRYSTKSPKMNKRQVGGDNDHVSIRRHSLVLNLTPMLFNVSQIRSPPESLSNSHRVFASAKR